MRLMPAPTGLRGGARRRASASWPSGSRKRDRAGARPSGPASRGRRPRRGSSASQTGSATPCSRPTSARTTSTSRLTHGVPSASAPAEPGQPQRGALDGDGGVLLGELDDRPADLAGQACGPCGRWPGRGRACRRAACVRGHQSLRSKRPRTPALLAQQLQGVRRVAGHVAVADEHRARRRPGPRRRARRRRTRWPCEKKMTVPPLGGGQDRAALAAGHVDADDGDVGRARRRRRRRRAGRSGRGRRRPRPRRRGRRRASSAASASCGHDADGAPRRRRRGRRPG